MSYEHWKSLAENIGFTLHDGIQDILESPQMRKYFISAHGEKSWQQLENIAKNPFINAIISQIKLLFLLGKFDDMEIIIYPHYSLSREKQSEERKPRLLLFFPRPLQMNLRLTKIGFFSGIKRFFIPAKFTNLTMQSLLKKISYSSNNAKHLELWLNDSNIASLLDETISFHPDLIIEDFGLHADLPQMLPSSEEIQNLLNQLSPIAKKFASLYQS